MLRRNGNLEDTDYDANIKRRDVFSLNKVTQYRRAVGSVEAAQHAQIQLMNKRCG
jgi:hypothetical protein